MSLWEKDVEMPSFETLRENRCVDVLIIGGGMTGLHSLYFFQNNDHVMLVEANEIGKGVSANTTGKVNYLQESTLGYLILKKKYTKAKMYLASQLEGIALLKGIIEKEHISCDWEQVSSYLVTRKKDFVEDIQKIEHFLKQVGVSVIHDESLNQEFLYHIGVQDTYVFHPLKYMKGLLQLNRHPVYEHTRIMDIQKTKEGYQCVTDQGFRIQAKRIIVACHYPFFFLPYFLPTKTLIEKSYLSACGVPKNLRYTYITMENPSESTRFYDDGKKIYQIFLGCSHVTSVSQNDFQHFQEVSEKFHYPFFWSNVDIMTFDHLPLIGMIQENIYLATGFQGWGMIQSVFSARMIYESVCGNSSPYVSLFSPKRSFLKRVFLLLPYGFLNGFSFLRSKWYRKSWYSDSLSFYHEDGKLMAKYTDCDGSEHIVHPVCPHMKCGLIFNEVEKTWDCPCHSSRFDMDGKVMKGPSKYDIKK